MSVWYHGRTVKSIDFSLRYVGNGTDQQGPGFYFSSDYKDAASYAYPDGVVITADIKPRKLTPKRAPLQDVMFLIDNLDPEKLESVLSDWDENPIKAKRKLAEGIINDSEPYLQAWIELYRYTPDQYLINMVKLGYDAHITKPNKTLPTKHLIVYNPSIINILRVDSTGWE